MNSRFEIYRDKRGEYRFRLLAANGQVVAAGQAYASKDGCLKGIAAARTAAAAADIVELMPNDALLAAADRGDAAGVRWALAQGANPNARDAEGETALIEAAEAGSLPAVRLLVRAGADIHAQDREGETALHESVEEGRTDVVRFLLNTGAKTNIRDTEGNTPLHDALRKGHIAIARMLLRAGASATVKNSEGRSPYDLAGGPGAALFVGKKNKNDSTVSSRKNGPKLKQPAKRRRGPRT